MGCVYETMGHDRRAENTRTRPVQSTEEAGPLLHLTAQGMLGTRTKPLPPGHVLGATRSASHSSPCCCGLLTSQAKATAQVPRAGLRGEEDGESSRLSCPRALLLGLPVPPPRPGVLRAHRPPLHDEAQHTEEAAATYGRDWLLLPPAELRGDRICGLSPPQVRAHLGQSPRDGSE